MFTFELVKRLPFVTTLVLRVNKSYVNLVGVGGDGDPKYDGFCTYVPVAWKECCCCCCSTTILFWKKMNIFLLPALGDPINFVSYSPPNVLSSSSSSSTSTTTREWKNGGKSTVG